ncbi:alkyl sulfatase dimerization domain-containing protein [Vibrio maritimus]|uniref:alkyl sulfatase dimerization domain-containing protein n=1 Tax=Vibrio maritimus TaxID=990268 RepID=UPI001F381084|nr:alkyl sulfatase dimerization domain-containing protein [Vibrio maritimus]
MNKNLITASLLIAATSFNAASAFASDATPIRSTNPDFFTNETVQSHLAKAVWKDTEHSYAYTKDSEFIPKAMTEFAKQMAPQIQEIVPNKLYLVSGFQLASTLVAVGDDGLVIVDPGENDTAAKKVHDVFQQFSDLPVKAVVYTHRHPDHAFGSAGWGVTEEQVESGEVKIIASENFIPNLINDVGVTGKILTQRTAYASVYLPPAPEGRPAHFGLGATFTAGPVSFFMPNTIVKANEPLKINVSGIDMEVFTAYGDAGTDEVDVYFPQYHHVHGSETIQGETFPNLYTLRGTKYRDVQEWYKGIDELQKYAEKADTYSGSHMRAWVGHDFINQRIQNYRDAIQYVHDQSIYYINHGIKRDELAEKVVLPANLANDPWLGEYYGSVAHSVRNIYDGYLGWYQGDATEIAKPSVKALANHYVNAMGGVEATIKIAKTALDNKQYGWAAEVLTNVNNAFPENMEARHLKADALRSWGYQQTNIYYRGFAISDAGELDGTIDRSVPWDFSNPAIVKVLPTNKILETFRVNLNATKAQGKQFSINFEVADTGEIANYTVRNQIAIFSANEDPKADATVQAAKLQVLKLLQDGDASKLMIKGNRQSVDDFFAMFDYNKANNINLVLPN